MYADSGRIRLSAGATKTQCSHRGFRKCRHVSSPASRGPRSLLAATCTARQIAGATVFESLPCLWTDRRVAIDLLDGAALWQLLVPHPADVIVARNRAS